MEMEELLLEGMLTTDEIAKMMKSLSEKENENKTDNDMVNHPQHYKTGKYECIEVLKEILTHEQFVGFCKGNAIKYLWRTGKKEKDKTVEDLEKADFYLKAVIDFIKTHNGKERNKA